MPQQQNIKLKLVRALAQDTVIKVVLILQAGK